MSEHHVLRVRGSRWNEIEKIAWKLSQKAERLIKPTDVADAILFKYSKQITLKDIEEAQNNR